MVTSTIEKTQIWQQWSNCYFFPYYPFSPRYLHMPQFQPTITPRDQSSVSKQYMASSNPYGGGSYSESPTNPYNSPPPASSPYAAPNQSYVAAPAPSTTAQGLQNLFETNKSSVTATYGPYGGPPGGVASTTAYHQPQAQAQPPLPTPPCMTLFQYFLTFSQYQPYQLRWLKACGTLLPPLNTNWVLGQEMYSLFLTQVVHGGKVRHHLLGQLTVAAELHGRQGLIPGNYVKLL